ncbi:MAG TPA: hypothetical protein VMG35_25480 [Bryobacteraceae bacterium]|nr:hypothetical protein [Bryobacteraceae bacterium]
MRNAPAVDMRRISLVLLCFAPWAAPLPGATLERLSLNDLIQKSTTIVRAKVLSSSADFSGSVIYTHWKLQVEEMLKGTSQPAEVLVPGGTARGFRQSVPGTPALVPGKDYLMFLWVSKSGSIYLTGWGQGLFELTKNSSGGLVAWRPPVSETMLDAATWLPVQDQGVRMSYAAIKGQISPAQAQGANQ